MVLLVGANAPWGLVLQAKLTSLPAVFAQRNHHEGGCYDAPISGAGLLGSWVRGKPSGAGAANDPSPRCSSQMIDVGSYKE